MIIVACLVTVDLSGQVRRRRTGTEVNNNENPNTAIRRPSTNTNTATNSNATYKSIDDYLRSSEYRSRENGSATVEGPSSDFEKLPTLIVNSEGAFELKKEQISSTRNTQDIFALNTSMIYPGNLIHVNSKLAEGKPQEVSLQKGKVKLSIDFNLGKGISSSATVDIDLGSVRQQIFNWLNSTQPDYRGKFDASMTQNYYTSEAHMAADLKVNASYLQNSCNVSLKTSSDNMKVVSVQNYTQNFYTVQASINSEMAQHFGPNVTAAQVKNEVQSYGPIAMITSVTYGRRAYRFREYVSSNFTFNGDEKVKISTGGVNVDTQSTQNVTNSSKSNKLWGFVQGGNHGDGDILSETEANDTNMAATLGKDTKVSATNPGCILFYSLTFLSSRTQIQTQFTDRFTDVKYVPCPKSITFEVHKPASQLAGTSIKYRVDYKVLHITSRDRNGNPTGYEIWDSPKYKGTKDGYTDYMEISFSQGEGQRTRTIPTKDCPDNQNCFIYGAMPYQLRMNRRAGGGYSTQEEGYLDSSINYYKIYVEGSNYAGKNTKIGSKSTGKN